MQEYDRKQNIRRAIVETIAFFDLFLFPLTVNEILKYLKVKSDYLEVLNTLDSLVREEIIEEAEGLYFLKGSQKNIKERKSRYNYSDRKFKIAIKISKYFRLIPWIRLIAVVNIIGRDNLRDNSDIDIFIIAEKNKLWLTRFFAVLIAKLMNVRPRLGNTRDKICLSFFLSEDNLDLDTVRGKNNDLYFSHWLLNLAPIYSRENSYEKLMEGNRKILNEFPNFYPEKISSKRELLIFDNSFYKKNWDLLFGGLENKIKRFQLEIMPRNLLDLAPQKKGVIISENIIKLHLNDRREEFLKKYNEKVSKIKI